MEESTRKRVYFVFSSSRPQTAQSAHKVITEVVKN